MYNIPDFIKNINGLKLFDRCLLAQIEYLSAKKGYCFAQNDYFADFFEVSVGTVKRSLKKMEDMGVIARVQTGWGKRYIYVTCAPVAKEEKAEEKAEEKPKENVVKISKRGFKYWSKVMTQPATKYHRAKDEKKLTDDEAKEADVGFENCMERWKKRIGDG